MGVNLSKGGNVNLSKEAPGLKKILIGLGWHVRKTDGAAFDLDASAFMLNDQGKVRGDADFIFYNQPKDLVESVVYAGDNRTGKGDGDDEQIAVNLEKVPADVQRIAVTVTIHEADTRRQNFGQVEKAFVRIVNQDGGAELTKYDLSEDAGTETAVIFGELYRHGTDWKFKAVGQGFKGGLKPLAASFGVQV